MEKCYILAEAAIKEETLTAAPSELEELIDGPPVQVESRVLTNSGL